MNLSRIIRFGLVSTVVSLLVACGGGSSSSSCPVSNPDCDANRGVINGLGVDGPLANAQVRLFALTDFLQVGAGAKNLLLDDDARSDEEGFADNLAIEIGSPAAPYVLYFSSNDETIDTTTDIGPVIEEVYTVVGATEFNERTDSSRFYASTLTRLAIDIAQSRAGSSDPTAVLGELADAQIDVLRTLGFGIDLTDSDFTLFGANAVPPVLDETSDEPSVAQRIADYRVALEVFTQLVTVVATNSLEAADPARFNDPNNPGETPTLEEYRTFARDIVDLVAQELGANRLLGDPFDGSDNTGLEDNVVAEIDNVDSDYLNDRLGMNGTTQVTIEDLLTGESGRVPAALPPLLNRAAPSDFDGDLRDNSEDDNDYNGAVQDDMDLDAIDDVVDNCPVDANTDQLNTDGDAFGDVCDDDIDGDGALNGDDDNPLDSTVITDLDDDNVDDIGGTGLSGPDNCTVGMVLFGDTSAFEMPPYNAVGSDDIPDITLTALQAFNPDQFNGSPGDDGILGTGDDILDGDNFGNACDEDVDGDGTPGDGFGGSGVALFGIILGDPDDLDPAASPTDADSDGAPNSTDNCPSTPNGVSAGPNEQENGGSNSNTVENPNGFVFGNSCDEDDDGYPESFEDLIGVMDIADGISIDNCFNLANNQDNSGVAPDGFGDACDSDGDNDGIDDISQDPDPDSAISTYRIDLFSLRQSSAPGEFRLETFSENSLATDGSSILGQATLTLADSTSDETDTADVGGEGAGMLDVGTGYQIEEHAVEFSGASGLTGAVTNLVNDSQNAVSAVNGIVATYIEPNLTVDTAGFAPWGNSAFIGNERLVLDSSVGNPSLEAEAVQSLSAILFSDGVHENADLTGDYGFVDLSITYSDVSVADSIIATTSRMFEASLDGSGNLSATSTASPAGTSALTQYGVSIGVNDGSVLHENSTTADLGFNAGTYTVMGTGIVDLNFDTGTLTGVADSAGNLISTSSSTRVGYGVRLESYVDSNAAAAAAAGQYGLRGLVIQPGRDKTVGYSFSGATLTIVDSDTDDDMVTATLNLGAAASRDVSTYDESGSMLPAVSPGSIASLGVFTSKPFAISESGRFGPVTFGAGAALLPFEMEGFYVDGKGFLIRYVESSVYESGGTLGGGVRLFFGLVPDQLPAGFQAFVDPEERLPLTTGVPPQDIVVSNGNPPSGEPGHDEDLPVDGTVVVGRVLGLIQIGASQATTNVVVDARADAGNPQNYSVIEGPADTSFTEDSFGQGIIWGIPITP